MAPKRLVQLFLSYAHLDQRVADVFLAEVKKQFPAAARYRYEIWRDDMIELGARWREAIEEALRACDLGLLLVSPSFLASPFIQSVELPRLMTRHVVPVGLEKVHFGGAHDLGGLDERQIFLLKGRRFFGELATSRERGAFVSELFLRTQRKLDGLYPVGVNP